MKYRCEVDIAFNDEKDAIAFLNQVESIKDNIYKGTLYQAPVYNGEELVTPAVAGDGIPNVKKFRYHKCFHDENPPKACGNYTNVDFDKTAEEHKAEDGKAYKTAAFKAEAAQQVGP